MSIFKLCSYEVIVCKNSRNKTIELQYFMTSNCYSNLSFCFAFAVDPLVVIYHLDWSNLTFYCCSDYTYFGRQISYLTLKLYWIKIIVCHFKFISPRILAVIFKGVNGIPKTNPGRKLVSMGQRWPNLHRKLILWIICEYIYLCTKREFGHCYCLRWLKWTCKNLDEIK